MSITLGLESWADVFYICRRCSRVSRVDDDYEQFSKKFACPACGQTEVRTDSASFSTKNFGMDKNNLETMKRHIKKAAPNVELDGRDSYFIEGVFVSLLRHGAVRLDSPLSSEAAIENATNKSERREESRTDVHTNYDDGDGLSAIEKAREEARKAIESASKTPQRRHESRSDDRSDRTTAFHDDALDNRSVDDPIRRAQEEMRAEIEAQSRQHRR